MYTDLSLKCFASLNQLELNFDFLQNQAIESHTIYMNELVIVQNNVELNTNKILSLNNHVLTCCENQAVETASEIDSTSMRPFSTAPNIVNGKTFSNSKKLKALK